MVYKRSTDHGESCAPLFAARTLNANDQYRVTLSPREENLRAARTPCQEEKSLTFAPKTILAGESWSVLLAFTQDPSQRAANGLCQAQAAPVIDPVTKTLFVGFTANLWAPRMWGAENGF